MDWDWNFTFDEVIPSLLPIVPVTINATLLSFALAATLGLVLVLVRLSKQKWLSVPTTELIEFIRGTPVLIQIFFLFFVLPEYGITIPPLTCGIIALGIHNAAYCSEVYRAGLEAIDRGQWEASRALNFNIYDTYRRIILPQAIPPVIPALGNYLIGIFKETPLLSIIAVVEMLHKAKMMGSEWFRYTEPFTIVGIFFLIMSLAAAFLVRKVEIYFNRRILTPWSL